MIKQFIIILIGLQIVSCSTDKTCTTCENEKDEHLKESPVSAIIALEKELEGFSSGSGMQYFNGFFYAVGDDDAYLWKFDKFGDFQDKWLIWDTSEIEGHRIRKKIKPDFEAMSFLPRDTDTSLLIFASGSKPIKRDYILQFDPNKKELIELSSSALPFYDWLRTEVFNPKDLNLEGAAFWNEQFILLNRATNTLLMLKKSGFMENIVKDRISHLDYQHFHYQLPLIQTDTARFSGASIIPGTNYLLFSASVELTEDWVDDGGILGSFIGIIDLEHPESAPLACELVTWENKETYIGKIEAVEGKLISDKKVHVVGITDNDNGKTNFLHIDFKF